MSPEVLLEIYKKIWKADDALDVYGVNFEALIAVVGETLIKRAGANWSMQKDKSNTVWEPYIEIGKHKAEFFNWLFEDIFINQEPDKPILYETYYSILEWIQFKEGKGSLLV